MYAQTNAGYPNRIQLVLAPFSGPLAQDGPLGAFDPRRDLEVYVDGVRQTIQTFLFDPIYNRYLIFLASAINLQGVVQVVYHVPSPPFANGTANGGWGELWGAFWGGGIGGVTLPGGFALIASYSTTGP